MMKKERAANSFGLFCFEQRANFLGKTDNSLKLWRPSFSNLAKTSAIDKWRDEHVSVHADAFTCVDDSGCHTQRLWLTAVSSAGIIWLL